MCMCKNKRCSSAMRFHIPDFLLHTGCPLRSLSRTRQHEQQWHRGKGPGDPGRVAGGVQEQQRWRCENNIRARGLGQGDSPPLPSPHVPLVQSSPVHSSKTSSPLLSVPGNPEPTADPDLGPAPTGRRACDQRPVVHLRKES